ncbi:MAG: hypothetical protein A4S09_05700 [Proteobacteria bacterium SG_bin7]|nr:MAG: hypothetical protein A4S09_05700 [Proteobacteria bacterium SG_bin7]
MGAKSQKRNNFDRRDSNVGLSLLILLLGIASFYFLFQPSKSKNSPTLKTEKSDSASIKEDRADRYYRALYLKKLRQEMQIDNDRVRNEAKKGIHNQSANKKLDTNNWPGIEAEQEQARRFEREEKSARDFDVVTPEDRIQNEIKRQQDEEYMNEEMSREFIRQLQENARKDGIEIRIDKNLRAYPSTSRPQ